MAKKLLWGKFHWASWSNDQALRLTSLAAQGLWMRMLCIAAEANPIGYVRVNGRALGVTDIAKLAGVTETECSSLLSELDRNGVFSRDKSGTIYSRRMVRDRMSQKQAEENGKKGGNPSLSKHEGISDLDNPPLKPPDKAKNIENRIKIERINNILPLAARAPPEGSQSPQAAFPSDGSLHYSPWGDLIRQHARGHDVDVVASAFRKFCYLRKIPFDAQSIDKTLATFCQKFRGDKSARH